MTIRAAIVEDSREIREGIAYLISSTPGFECVGTFNNAEDAVRCLPQFKADVVLMDIHLPGMTGIECVRRLKPTMPDTQFLMLTIFEDHERIFDSLKAGATGYLLKKTPPNKLIEALTDAHNGGSPMSNQIARLVIQSFHQPMPKGKPGEELSPREQDILALLAKGHLYKEIAKRDGISIETVRGHVSRIYKKLHVRSRSEAILKVVSK